MVENISYNYILEHDTGYAPNPFFNYLTLAACKPCLENKGSIRKLITKESLDKGPVWVFANGGTNLLLEDYEYRNGNLLKIQSNCTSYHRLVYAFKICEVLNFENYYKDPRFKRKQRINSKTQIETYGDNNIPAPKSSNDKQIKQYIEDPKVTLSNQGLEIKDSKILQVKVDNTLISAKGDFYYFGCFAPNILKEFGDYFLKGSPGHKPIKDEKIRDKITDKIEEICLSPGIHGFPSFHNGKRYKDDATHLDYLSEIYSTCLNSQTKKIIADWINELQKIENFKNPTLKSIV